MARVIIAGASGRMGSRLVALARESRTVTLAAALERKGHPSIGRDVSEVVGGAETGVVVHDDLSAVIDQGNVVIDFSSPAAVLPHANLAAQHQVAMVIGTTGLTGNDVETLRTLSRDFPCVLSPNMSVGVNLLFKIVAEIAAALGEDYDIEVIEAHHRLKKDAPSGTALKLADVLARARKRDLGHVGVYARHGLIGERKPGEIGVQTIRAGDIVGDHTVLFGGIGERIEVTHRVQSRDTFAHGALRAAQWVVDRPPGLYDMLDVLGLR